MKRYLLTLALLLTFVVSGISQKTFADVDYGTFDKKAKIPKFARDKTGQGHSLIEGHKITKVALVSFFVTMPIDQDKYGGGSLTFQNSASGSYIKYVANSLYDESKDAMTQAFKEKGIELLLYEDFTDEQKAILNSSDGSEFLNQTTRVVTDWYTAYGRFKETVIQDVGGSAYNYQNFGTAITLPDDYSMFGVMAKAMGVDALVIINHNFDLEKGAAYSDLRMNIIGVNPISYDEAIGKAKGKLAKKLITKFYWDGVIFTNTLFAFGKPIVVAERKKNEYFNESFEGFDTFMKSAIEVTIDHYNKRAKL